MTLLGKDETMTGWQPIETAPKPANAAEKWGPPTLVCWAGVEGSECLLQWKHNRRISSALDRGEANPDGVAAEYWGDPNENDDYDLAKPGAGPTHWLKLPVLWRKRHKHRRPLESTSIPEEGLT